MKKWSSLLIACCLSLAACSSSGQGDLDPAVAEGVPSDPEAERDAKGRAARSSPRERGSAETGGTAEGTEARKRSGGATGTLGPVSQGVFRDRIKIGFWEVLYLSNDQCAAYGLGDSTICTTSETAETAALVEYINEHGGIAGRRLEAVIVESSADRSYSTEAAAACEAFAQDHKVFAVLLPPQFERADFVSCMAGHNIPVIDNGWWPFEEESYATQSDLLYHPSRARPERWVPAFIDGLAAQDFFGPGSRVGLVTFAGEPFSRIVRGVLEPRLAAHGTELAQRAELSVPNNTGSAYGSMNAEIGNAILRFKSAGIDRVIFFAPGAEPQFFWVQAAEGQDFRPRYGFNTTDFPYPSMELYAPQAQLRGSVGVGWLPGYDVAEQRDPISGAATKRCRQILLEAGQEPNRGRGFGKCDNIFFLRAALARAPVLNVEGLRQGVEALGSSFRSVSTFSTQFGPGLHDGVASVRHFAFEDDCSCFQYVGRARRIPG